MSAAAVTSRVGDSWHRLLGRDARPLAVLAVAFALSRAVYAALGVRFDVLSLDYASQLVDAQLLETRLLETIWYLHSQPPLFNLFVGLVLKFSPFGVVGTFHAVYLALGALLLWGLYDLGHKVGLSRRVAVVVAVIVGCGPVAVLYENWLTYEYPLAVLLVLLVDAGARWVRHGRVPALATFVTLAAAATLTRSLLHPVWLVAVVVFVLLARRPQAVSRGVVAAVAVPLVLVGGVMVKNQVLFGSPELSSWFGFNVYHVAVSPLPPDVFLQLYGDGVLEADPVTPPRCELERPDVPVLAEEYEQGWSGEVSGRQNFNWECLPPYYRSLADDAFAAARAEPRRTAKTVIGSFEVWAGPSTFYPGITPNRLEVEGLEAAYRRTVLLSLPWTPPVAAPLAWPAAAQAPDRRLHISLTIVAATLVVVGAAAAALIRWRRAGMGPARAAVVLGGGTILFVTLAGNLFEHGENNRFRFVVEPLTLVLAVAVAAAAGRWGQRRRGASTPPATALDQEGENEHV